jgi:hypothetical protein
MVAVSSNETSVNFYQTTRRYIPQDSNFQTVHLTVGERVPKKRLLRSSQRLYYAPLVLTMVCTAQVRHSASQARHVSRCDEVGHGEQRRKIRPGSRATWEATDTPHDVEHPYIQNTYDI